MTEAVARKYKLSKNFFLLEFLRTDHVEFMPKQLEIQDSAITKLGDLVKNVLQPTRDYLDDPIEITSGFRCDWLNQKVGGVQNSQHTLGEAADIKTIDMKKMFLFIFEHLEFDQLIWEHTPRHFWIHVSYRKNHNRKQAMTFDGNSYKPYKENDELF